MISDTLIHEGAMSMTVTPLQADFEPGKIIALHLNYPSRSAQRGRTPAFPSFFLKPITSLATSGSNVERPAGCELLAFEGEIALIIGTRARRVSHAEVVGRARRAEEARVAGRAARRAEARRRVEAEQL